MSCTVASTELGGPNSLVRINPKTLMKNGGGFYKQS